MQTVATYYDRIAPDYDEHLTRDTWTRSAFQHLVAKSVPPGSLLLDFGCGTGTDALWYADNGYRVIACDNSAGMLSEFRKKCAGPIALGTVNCGLGDHAALRALSREKQPAAVVCNFAVLSHMDDTRPLFESFAGCLSAGRHLIVSVLNPFYWSDLRYGWWWKGIAGCLRSGRMHIPGDPYDTFRHRIRTLDQAASPYFVRTDQAAVDLCMSRTGPQGDWSAPRLLRERLEKRYWMSYPMRVLGRFIFLVYRRCE